MLKLFFSIMCVILTVRSKYKLKEVMTHRNVLPPLYEKWLFVHMSVNVKGTTM